MPIDFIWVGMIAGMLSGFLVNYLSDVLPYTRRFSRPFCLNCQERTSWWDYLAWKRCSHCHKGRSIRTWAVQIFFLLAISYLWIQPSQHLGFLVGTILLIFFGIVFVIDVEYRLVLHQVSIAGALLGLAIGLWRHGLLATIIGGATGFGFMLALYYLGDVYSRWMARRRGQTTDEVALGFGDVNLAGVIGLLLGWPGIVLGLISAILLGGLVSLIYLLFLVISRNYKPFAAIPYAPFLVLGASILLYLI